MTQGCSLVFRDTQANNELNPFVHQNHPNHKETVHTRNVKRTVIMTLRHTGRDEQTGTYTEVIKGLAGKDIVVSGDLKLSCISRPHDWVY